MSSYEVKKVDDMEAVFRGAFKRARAELGVESFDPNMAPNMLCLGCQFITPSNSIWIWAF